MWPTAAEVPLDLKPGMKLLCKTVDEAWIAKRTTAGWTISHAYFGLGMWFAGEFIDLPDSAVARLREVLRSEE